MEFIAYRHGFLFDMGIVPAPAHRDWMDLVANKHAYRCLPMILSNQLGWNILNDRPFRTLWNGGDDKNSILFEPELPTPSSVLSHFGHGIISFIIPFLFRVPPDFQLLFRGPPNQLKDGIHALEGLVEADWAVATATMNWKFTRPDVWVSFLRGEAICTVVPMQVDTLEKLTPRELHISEDPILSGRYETWVESRRDFIRALGEFQPEAIKSGWQRDYFRGTSPARQGVEPATGIHHRTRLNLREFARISNPEPHSDSHPEPTESKSSPADRNSES